MPCVRPLGAAKPRLASARKQRGLLADSPSACGGRAAELLRDQVSDQAIDAERPLPHQGPLPLGRRDAVLYLIAAGLGSFGLGVAQFYLNFLYRSLGFDAFAIGLLAGAEALGVVAGAIPAAIFTRGRSRRAAILFGGA